MGVDGGGEIKNPISKVREATVAMGAATSGPAMAGLLAKATGLRSWWGEGSVIAFCFPAPLQRRTKQPGHSRPATTPHWAERSNRPSGAYSGSQFLEKRRLCPSEAVRQLFLVGRRACGKVLVGGLARRRRWNSVETTCAKAIQKLLRRRLWLSLQFTTQITF
jgi:hypothetical protein